jgi:putative transposase
MSTGSSPICSELPIAPSTYHAFRTRLPSARTVRDAMLMPLLLVL